MSTTDVLAPPAATRQTRRSRSLRGSTPYLFIAPGVLLLVVFGVLPIGVALLVSLTDLNLTGLGDLSTVHFIGLANYGDLFSDSDFWRALGVTAFFVVFGVPIILVISLLFAVGLDQGQGRFFRALRAFYFLPAVTGVIAIALIWGYLLNSQFGLLNHILVSWGLQPVPWLSDPTMARFSVAMVAIWRATGLNTIIFLAGLQAIPKDYYEAAALDGAGGWRIFSSITLPLLKFAIFFVTVTTLIGWLQFFDEPYVLTRGGGPNGATTSISLFLYQQGFQSNRFGYASAGSVVLFLIMLIITAVQLRLRRKQA